MTSPENIEKLIRNAEISSNPLVNKAVLGDLLKQFDIAGEKQKASVTPPNKRRIIMKSPITKIAVAAAILIAVTLGLCEFIGTGSQAGIVWAEVASKVQASRGLIVRCTETTSVMPFDADYTMNYFSPTHSRTDFYKAGQITHTFYTDFTAPNTKTLTAVYHTHKHYLSRTFDKSGHEFLLEQHDDWMNPRYLIQTILSCEHTKLGQKTIDGVLCEGIETTDPAMMGPLPGPVDLLEVHLRLWVDAETKYPVLFKSKIRVEAEGQAVSSEGVMDQFQWDVELDPSFLEPHIPPDYKDMRNL